MDEGKEPESSTAVLDKPVIPQTQTDPGGNMIPPQPPTAVGGLTPQEPVNESPVTPTEAANTSILDKVKNLFSKH